MSATRKTTTRTEPGCDALGCAYEPAWVMNHPIHGYRVVCDLHASEHWVIDRV